MKYKFYGVKTFGDKVVSLEELDNDSTINNYKYFIYEKRFPDAYGNGNYELTILDVVKKKEIGNDFWTINDIKGIWNWNNDWTTISLVDQSEDDGTIKVEERYKRGHLYILEKTIVTILDVINNYTYLEVYKIINDKSIGELTQKLEFGQFIQLRNKIKNYIELCNHLTDSFKWDSVPVTYKNKISKKKNELMLYLLNADISLSEKK